jgi:hypothetical protein
MIQTPIPQSQLNKSRFDKFLLILNLPPILRNSNTNNLNVRTKELVQKESIQFSVYGSVIPTVSVPEVEAPYAGGTYKLSSNSRPPYDNITVNFTIDNKFNNYWVIYKWLDVMSDDVGIIYNATEVTDTGRETYKLNPKLQPQAYQTDFTLYGKDEFDNNIVKFTYTKAFPISLGSIDYNYREPGEIETSFTFAFSQFLTELV